MPAIATTTQIRREREDVYAGLRFKDGNVSFHVLGPVKNKDRIWEVGCSVPSSGFKRTAPKTMQMPESQILDLAGKYLAETATKDMFTIGTLPGSRNSSAAKTAKTATTGAKASSRMLPLTVLSRGVLA